MISPRIRFSALFATVVGVAAAPAAFSAPLMVNALYDPLFGGNVVHEGHLEFVNQREFPQFYPQGIPLPTTPPGVILTEEYTGYTTPTGQDIIEVGDSETTAGDRADFDWVQENRPCETGGVCTNGPVNHPNQVGAMGWTIGQPDLSPHLDPGTGAAHNHSDEEGLASPPALPHLENDAYMLDVFNAVDVFSIISVGQDVGVDPADPTTHQAAALDYVVDFGNSVTGAFSPGVLSVVWIPGWTNQTFIDDYVARWVPTIAGSYDVVAIEPASGVDSDQVTEIDAIKGIFAVPEPGTLALIGIGTVMLLVRRRRYSA